MNYRTATANDAEEIALLHAESWRMTYRGMLSDEYLDNHVGENRLTVWQERLTSPKAGQFVLVAEENGIIQGFVCVFGAADEEWGALLDNLHIRAAQQGRGLGRKLMHRAGTWIQGNYADTAMHLWVFAANEGACRFYDRLGGTVNYEMIEDEFGGCPVPVVRYVWDNVEPLINKNEQSNYGGTPICV